MVFISRNDVDEFHLAGNLVAGQLAAAEFDDVIAVRGFIGLQCDKSQQGFPPLLAGNTNHGCVRNRGMFE